MQHICWHCFTPEHVARGHYFGATRNPPQHRAPQVNDATIALFVSVIRDRFSLWTKPHLKLPAPNAQQPQPNATLEAYDHSVFAKFQALDAPAEIPWPA